VTPLPDRRPTATPAGSRFHLDRYHPGERHALHAHPYSSLTLVLSGWVEERVGSEIRRGTALSVVVKPAGVDHADLFGVDGARTLRVELSTEEEALARSSGFWPGRWWWSHGGDVSRIMIRMVQAIALGSGPGPPLEDLLYEALGALRGETESAPRSRPPSWIVRVREALDEESGSIGALAERERVHPVVLARVFRRSYGTTPTEYRRRARARRAAGLLTGTRRPLVDVALEAGYSDQAHLTRDLKTVLGVTPVAIRNLS
jgi:AraC family transcriptional regulator